MARVLLGDELGAGLSGRLTLAAVGEALAQAGHECVFALQDVADGQGALQAPVWRGPASLKIPLIGRAAAQVGGLADLLAVAGLADADIVASVAGAWERLIDLVRPDLVVAHLAPGLLLAAEGRAPRLAVGGGYAMAPLHGAALPRHDPLRPPVTRDADILAAVNAVRAGRGLAPTPSVADVFASEARLVFALPGLDFHGLTRRDPLLGPLAPQTPAPVRTGVAAVLSIEQANVEDLVFGLVAAAAGRPDKVHVRGAPASMVRYLAQAGAWATLEEAMAAIATSRLALHDGEGEVVQRAALAATPQLVLRSNDPEKSFLADRVVGLQIGRLLAPKRNPAAETEGAVRAAHDDPDLAAWCAHRAQEWSAAVWPGAPAAASVAQTLLSRAA